MQNKMPPLNPLRVFDVTARCDSFTEAAEELLVTQAAVSRQISVLEDYFNIKLFERDPRSLKLTAEGRRLHRETGPAFEMIGWATHEILRKRDGNIVTIQTYPTLTALLLLPQLTEFLDENRGISLNFPNGVRPRDFVDESADIFIRLGAELSPGRTGFKLAGDHVAPAVCPEVFTKCGSDPEKLISEYPLLMSKYRQSDWSDWAKMANLDIQNARFTNFDSSHLAYYAAQEGLGVCVGQLFLIEKEIEAGRLILPFKDTLNRPLAYWCEWSENRHVTAQMQKTISWLKALREKDVLEK